MFNIKYKYLGIVALGSILSFTSCDKNSDSDADEEVFTIDHFYAVVDGDNQDGLKSYQQGCLTHGIHNKWNNNDIIDLRVYEIKGQNKNNPGKLLSGMTGKYKKSITENIFNAIEAVNIKGNASRYFVGVHNCKFNDNNNNRIDYSVSNAQNYGDSIVNSMPMYCNVYKQSNTFDINNLGLKFHNLASIIRFKVSLDSSQHPDHLYLKKINVTANKQICGEGYAELRYDGGLNVYSYWNNPVANNITLVCEKPITNGEQSYAMVVVPFSNADLNIEITRSDNKTLTLEKYGVSIENPSIFKSVEIDIADKNFK